ncbi:DEAD-box ATP-dependent RNA helicase 37 [Raphanus sativus]|nr:DEAD-box ATP-dependent RNA helicase 37 [Raphanus sativus]
MAFKARFTKLCCYICILKEREVALKSFKSGRTPIDVAARGLDIPHVAHVVNLDLPDDMMTSGKSGLATAFFNDGNTCMARPLAELMMQEANQEVPEMAHTICISFLFWWW